MWLWLAHRSISVVIRAGANLNHPNGRFRIFPTYNTGGVVQGAGKEWVDQIEAGRPTCVGCFRGFDTPRTRSSPQRCVRRVVKMVQGAP